MIHHAAIITSDVDRSLRFWRDGLGFGELMDREFIGDWPTLFGAPSTTLRSIFLGDSSRPDAGVLELVVIDGAGDAPPTGTALEHGFFLLSVERDVDPTLARLAELGFDQGVRRITMPAPNEGKVQMAVIAAPDGILVELVGLPT